MSTERRLKELYERIERGRCITLNDLVFLSEHDADCYTKTYQALVLDGPEEMVAPKEVPNSSANMITMTVQQHVDEIIDILRKVGIREDVMKRMNAQDVLELLEEKAVEVAPENDRYEYFNSYEPKTLLNAKA